MQRNEGIKTQLKIVSESIKRVTAMQVPEFTAKESKTRAMRNEKESHIFELEEAEIAKVRDGSMS